MNARPLLTNQRVSFDTHQWGDGQAVRWENLHLEKLVLGSGLKVKYPLFGNQQPTGFQRGRRADKKQLREITNEIKRALKDDKLRQQLAEDVSKVLNGFGSGKITAAEAREAAQKLAGHFGLQQEFTSKVEQEYKGRLIQMVTYHPDTISTRQFMIVQNKRYVRLQEATRIYPLHNPFK